MARDAEATRARLIQAATAEFARHGIAGARVDRIADAAKSNKAQIYHYFGSKDGLFAAVMEGYVRRSVESEYFDARDLPETAAVIYDGFVADPELARLVTWFRLESAQADLEMPELDAANAAKVRAIAQAQDEHVVSRRFPPEVLLGLVLTIAAAWNDLPTGFRTLTEDVPVAHRRAYVKAAVERLVRA